MSAVLDVFWRKGWQSTSMADLAEAAEVQRGSLYHAYGGKEALFLLAFEAYATRFWATPPRPSMPRTPRLRCGGFST
ncbi:TetR/AcrR family transcriptional regulator [Pseudomonas chlororaphis subsp. piscium]|nr:TetR/AcrR family transcriptional regulator [Pseudomonas chlororaphis subsp. piscium]